MDGVGDFPERGRGVRVEVLLADEVQLVSLLLQGLADGDPAKMVADG
jgi:hypothetical protein